MLEGKLVRFRALELSDLDQIMKFVNNYEMRRFLGDSLPISRNLEEEWIKENLQKQKEGKIHIFSIENKETSEFLGTISLENISSINHSAELGIAVFNPENWDKGYGTDSVKLLLSIGFNHLNLHTIHLGVFEFNDRARKVYQKVGFNEVGKFRESHFSEGKYHNVILMDILAEEYHKLHNKSTK